jgi:hypothetical protein
VLAGLLQIEALQVRQRRVVARNAGRQDLSRRLDIEVSRACPALAIDGGRHRTPDVDVVERCELHVHEQAVHIGLGVGGHVGFPLPLLQLDAIGRRHARHDVDLAVAKTQERGVALQALLEDHAIHVRPIALVVRLVALEHDAHAAVPADHAKGTRAHRLALEVCAACQHLFLGHG